MPSKKFGLAISIFVTFIVVAITVIGIRYGRDISNNREARNLAFVQGVLAYNHFKEYQEIEQLVEQKCYEQAVARAKFNKDIQAKLLASYLLDTNDPNLEKYVADRDVELLKLLPSLDSKGGSTITLAPCSPRKVEKVPGSN